MLDSRQRNPTEHHPNPNTIVIPALFTGLPQDFFANAS
jgi:hypothetical protein